MVADPEPPPGWFQGCVASSTWATPVPTWEASTPAPLALTILSRYVAAVTMILLPDSMPCLAGYLHPTGHDRHLRYIDVSERDLRCQVLWVSQLMLSSSLCTLSGRLTKYYQLSIKMRAYLFSQDYKVNK